MSIAIPRVAGFADAAPASSDREARVGLIVPAINTVAEPELQRLGPISISFHSTRIDLGDGGPEWLRAMVAASGAAAALLAELRPDLLLFHCTSASMASGPEAVKELREQLERNAGCPVLTTGAAVLEALESLGVGRVALVTPYTEEVTRAEAEFLRARGIEVPAATALALHGSEFAARTPRYWQERALAIDTTDADAVFLSCTNIRALEAVPAIERELGLPVVTSNQAALWGVLRALGQKLPSEDWRGSLFATRAGDAGTSAR